MTFDNFIIKPITNEDAENFFQLLEDNRDRIKTYFPGIMTFTKDIEQTKIHIAERIAGSEKGQYMIYLVVDKDANKLAGAVQLKDIDFNAGKREFGYFVDRDYENKGIATKSILAASRFCFDALNLNKVFLRTAEENIASRRVAEKCGFSLEGILRNDFMTSDGKFLNSFYYGLLKSDLK